MTVTGRRRVDRIDFHDVGRREPRLDVAAVAVIAGGENDAALAAKLMRAAVGQLRFDPDHAAVLDDEFLCRGIQPDIDTEFAAMPGQVIRERFRVRHHVVHAVIAVRRLGHRPHEHYAERHQPVEHLGRVVDEDAAQLEVVARRERSRVQREVFEVLIGGILDAGLFLMRRIRRRNRADRPRSGAAGLRIFFEQYHFASQPRDFRRCGEPRAAAADDDDIRFSYRCH